MKSAVFINILSLLFCGTFASAEWREQVSNHRGNVKVSPLGLLIGYYNIDLDFAMDDHWALGPTLSYYSWNFGLNSSSFKATSYAVGARGSWFSHGVYQDGLYISPILSYVGASVSGTSGTTSASGSASAVSVSGLVGYHWFWDTFNMNLGVGYSAILGNVQVTATASDGSTYSSNVSTSNASGGLALDFMMGILF